VKKAGKKVLSISLDPALLETRKRIIEQAIPNCQVVSASNYSEIEAACKANQFALVIIGHTLPRPEKLRVFSKIKKLQPRAKVLELHLTSGPVTQADLTLDGGLGPQALADRVTDMLM